MQSVRGGSHAVVHDRIEGSLGASAAGRGRRRGLDRLSTRSTIPARARYRSSDNVGTTERTTRSLHDGVGDFDGVAVPNEAVEGLDGLLGLLWRRHVDETSSASLSIQHGEYDAVYYGAVSTEESGELITGSVKRQVENVEILVRWRLSLLQDAMARKRERSISTTWGSARRQAAIANEGGAVCRVHAVFTSKEGEIVEGSAPSRTDATVEKNERCRRRRRRIATSVRRLCDNGAR